MYNFKVDVKASFLENFKKNETVNMRIEIFDSLYQSEDFYVYKAKKERDAFSINSNIELYMGVAYEIEGVIDLNKKGEKVLNLKTAKFSPPKTKEETLNFISIFANSKKEEIYSNFGDDFYSVLKFNPFLIKEKIKGVGEKTIQKWQEKLETIEGKTNIVNSLFKIGLNSYQISKILKENKQEEVLNNPYILIDLFYNFNFKTCDKIALSLGINQNDERRIKACIEYALKQEEQEGHCFVTKENLINIVRRYLSYQVSEKEIINILELNFIIKSDKVYRQNVYEIENFLASKIKGIIENKRDVFQNTEEILEEYLKKKNIVLEEKQREAVLTFAKSEGGFFILNGGAGCGKTFTLNIILDILTIQKPDLSIKIFAPTGKASKVAQKSTKREATTIHRGVRYNPETGPEYNINNPLVADCIVVDESSMIDIYLAKMLFEAIDNKTKVIFLGDTNQLPSIGPGNILKDLIESGKVETVTLNVVKRQGKESGIYKNAINIINKKMIYSNLELKDTYIKDIKTQTEGINEIIQGFKVLNKVFSIDDIQILSPQRNGITGVDSLNYIIQQIYNKNNEKKILNKKVLTVDLKDFSKKEEELYFEVGDKVIHIVNNYKAKWYMKDRFLKYKERLDIIGITNGEVGIIEEIIIDDFSKTKTIIVKYGEDEYMKYENDFSELEHAYVLTIHKSQGSQWKAIILAILENYEKMLNNNLLYTGYTRAEKFAFVLCEKERLQRIINKTDTIQRNTTLKERLQK